jgi:hypothetical protein
MALDAADVVMAFFSEDELDQFREMPETETSGFRFAMRTVYDRITQEEKMQAIQSICREIPGAPAELSAQSIKDAFAAGVARWFKTAGMCALFN